MAEPEPHRGRPLTERNGTVTVTARSEIRRRIHGLLSDDFTLRAESIEELEKFGAAAADEIVHALETKCVDPHASSSLTDALEEIGKPATAALIHSLTHVPEVTSPREAYLLENLIDTLGRLDDRHTAGPLADQLAKLNRAIRRNGNHALTDVCEATKVRIHECLADMGDSRALDDLIRMLGDGRKRVRDGVVDAIIRIGDRRALIPLLRLYAVEDDVSYSGASDIREAFRTILRREKVSLEDRLFKSLTRDERAMLHKLFFKPARAGSKSGGGP